LQAIDPEAAARIHATDPQRILRALEVYEITGQSMSALHATGRGEPLSCDVLKIGLLPTDRAVLHARIEQRLATMLGGGFEREVRTLMVRDDLHAELPALRAVGYRQMWAALAGDEPMDKVGDRILVATRQYARRQLTWLRGEPDMNYFELDAGNLVGRVMRRLDEWLDLTRIKK
jgi:tRNA dimethylallyltransferase